VEEVGGRGKKAFTNYDELWEILSSSRSIMQKRKSAFPARREDKKGRK